MRTFSTLLIACFLLASFSCRDTKKEQEELEQAIEQVQEVEKQVEEATEDLDAKAKEAEEALMELDSI